MEHGKRPEPIKNFAVQDRGSGIFEITAPPMRYKQYLIIGEEKAMLIDTGFGVGSLKEVVDGITDKPLILLNTHGHPDHGGGNAEFGSPFLRAEDNERYADKCAFETRLEEAGHWGIPDIAEQLLPTPPAPTALEENAVFDLGGRMLRVIHTPGHTLGSICIYDEETGALFTGDNTNARGIFLDGEWGSTVTEYLASMEKIRNLNPSVLYTGHMPGAVGPEQIDRQIACAQKILAGEKGEYTRTPMAEGWQVTIDGGAIMYTEGKI